MSSSVPGSLMPMSMAGLTPQQVQAVQGQAQPAAMAISPAMSAAMNAAATAMVIQQQQQQQSVMTTDISNTTTTTAILNGGSVSPNDRSVSSASPATLEGPVDPAEAERNAELLRELTAERDCLEQSCAENGISAEKTQHTLKLLEQGKSKILSL